jgi:hypothetical protein
MRDTDAMQPSAARTVGLVLAAAQGALLTQFALAVPLMLLGDRTGAIEMEPPMQAADYLITFLTLSVVAALGAALLLSVWKLWRKPSRAWLMTTVALVAAQPLVWLYDARGSALGFKWEPGAVLPIATLVLLLWRQADDKTRPQAVPRTTDKSHRG